MVGWPWGQCWAVGGRTTGDDAPAKPAVVITVAPGARWRRHRGAGPSIDLEGHHLHIIAVAQASTAPSTIVHIPDLNAMIVGDVAYNGIHPWLAFTDHDKCMRWIASVEPSRGAGPQDRCRRLQAPGRTRR